jgi:hypothetical protein
MNRVEHAQRPVHVQEREYGFREKVRFPLLLFISYLSCRPLNPVLGEYVCFFPSDQPHLYHSSSRLFYGQWPDTNNRGRTDLLVEQVSHHPPITAYVIENKMKRLRLVGHNAQKTSFSGLFSILYRTSTLTVTPAAGSIIVKQIGHAVLTVSSPSGGQDEFLITLPRLRIDGLWYVPSHL